MTNPRPLVPVLVFLGMVAAIVGSLGAPLVPTVAAATHVSLTNAQWTLTISLLAGAIATPVMGRLCDGPRRRQVVLVALAVVAIGTLLSALSLSFGALIVGRGLMGVGLGLTPLTIATAREALSGERQRSVVAMLSITAVAGIGVGYPIFGFIAQHLTLRAAFWFGTGIVVIAFFAALVVFPASPPRQPQRLDIPGSVMLGIGVAGLILGLSELETWSAPTLVTMFIGSILVLFAWVFVELRAPHPLVDLRLLRHRSVLTADVTALLAGFGMYVLMSMSVRFVQTPSEVGYGFGASVGLAGLVLLPFSAMSVVATRVAPLVARRLGSRSVLPIGSLIFVLAETAFVLDRSSLWMVFVVMALAGLGIGSIFAGVPALIVSAVPTSETGSVMSFNQVLRYIGYTLGSALAATILEAHTSTGEILPTNRGYSVAGLLGMAALVVAAAISAVLPPRSVRPTTAVLIARGSAVELADRTPNQEIEAGASSAGSRRTDQSG